MVNKNGKDKFSVDINWNVTTGNSTILKDQSTVNHTVFGLKGDDNDVTTNPKVVEEALNGTDAGQTWFVTEVKTTEAENTFYTFSIDNYFLTGSEETKTVKGYYELRVKLDDKGHLFLFNHFIDMRTTVSLSISY